MLSFGPTLYDEQNNGCLANFFLLASVTFLYFLIVDICRACFDDDDVVIVVDVCVVGAVIGAIVDDDKEHLIISSVTTRSIISSNVYYMCAHVFHRSGHESK